MVSTNLSIFAIDLSSVTGSIGKSHDNFQFDFYVTLSSMNNKYHEVNSNLAFLDSRVIFDPNYIKFYSLPVRCLLLITLVI